jgi:hypothetical protein
MDPGPIVAAFHLISYSSFLIHQSLWHPYLSKIDRPLQLWRLRRAVGRCSKIGQMEWLSDIDPEQDLARLGNVWRWVKAVEHQGGL